MRDIMSVKDFVNEIDNNPEKYDRRLKHGIYDHNHKTLTNKEHCYEINLESCVNSSAILNWILHLQTKGWCTPEILFYLVLSFRKILDLYGKPIKMKSDLKYRLSNVDLSKLGEYDYGRK